MRKFKNGFDRKHNVVYDQINHHIFNLRIAYVIISRKIPGNRYGKHLIFCQVFLFAQKEDWEAVSGTDIISSQ